MIEWPCSQFVYYMTLFPMSLFLGRHTKVCYLLKKDYCKNVFFYMRSPPPLAPVATIQKSTVCLRQGNKPGVRSHWSITFTSLLMISQSFSAVTLLVLCLQPGHRQLGLLPYVSSWSCQSIYPSINPSIHYIAKINPRTDNPPHFPTPLLCCPSITLSPYSSIHTSLWLKKH